MSNKEYQMSGQNIVATLARMWNPQVCSFLEAMPLSELQGLCYQFKCETTKDLIKIVDELREGLEKDADDK